MPRRAFAWVYGYVSLGLYRCLNVVVMGFLTSLEFPLLLTTLGRETTIPGLPPASSMKSGGKGGQRFKIAELEASELEPSTLRGYVRRSEPCIVKNCPPAMFADLQKYSPEIPADAPKDKLLIDQFSLPRLGSMQEWLFKYVGKRVLYLARFSGGYKGGYAHIDSFPSYNFYYVKRGRKHVYIVPRQYNPLLKLVGGYDSVFVGDDKADDSSLGWLETIPGCYEFEVGEGDILLFNNSACIHKFLNLTQNPEIFTMRLVHSDSSPTTLWNDCLNWEGAKYFTGIMTMGKTSARDTASIEGEAPAV
eukprot:CAMPEP_0182463666 /NCGR_PEP_ID=MMETSP1319-20130603/7824_1 /TAXON_ID=172717 /ORGANISM="Bolidomonas pacifica, Strain RCC208" /LENGTH=304 /DNA_ID=CAMNT_0024663237 /DNA_START=65 /DNA_END=979 /DNA_ORIENTATION=-